MATVTDEERIELSILTAPSDLGYLEPTLHHQLSALAASPFITRRVLVADLGDDRSPSGPAAELVRLAERLVTDGRLDEWRRVPWGADEIGRTMERWYGDASMEPRADGGRARYQYAWSIDASTEPRVLHLDSDVLFHDRSTRWLDRARVLFCERPDAVAVAPMAGVPQATTASEWLFGPRADRTSLPVGWSAVSSMSSRAILLDRPTMERRLLPLSPGPVGEQWEAAMSRGLSESDLRGYTYVDRNEYFLHPRRHNPFHARHVRDLIALVEAGHYPYRRFGYPWDLSTEGYRRLPWLLLVGREQLLSRRRRGAPTVAVPSS